MITRFCMAIMNKPMPSVPHRDQRSEAAGFVVRLFGDGLGLRAEQGLGAGGLLACLVVEAPGVEHGDGFGARFGGEDVECRPDMPPAKIEKSPRRANT